MNLEQTALVLEGRKKQSPWIKLARLRYPKLKGLYKAMEARSRRYNETADYIDDLETRKEIFVIRPETNLRIGRAETDKGKLHSGYDAGYADAAESYPDLYRYLKNRD